MASLKHFLTVLRHFVPFWTSRVFFDLSNFVSQPLSGRDSREVFPSTSFPFQWLQPSCSAWELSVEIPCKTDGTGPTHWLGLLERSWSCSFLVQQQTGGWPGYLWCSVHSGGPEFSQEVSGLLWRSSVWPRGRDRSQTGGWSRTEDLRARDTRQTQADNPSWRRSSLDTRAETPRGEYTWGGNII